MDLGKGKSHKRGPTSSQTDSGVDTPFLTVLKTWTSPLEHSVIIHVCVRLEFPEVSATRLASGSLDSTVLCLVLDQTLVLCLGGAGNGLWAIPTLHRPWLEATGWPAVDTPFLTVLKTWTSPFEHPVIIHVCVRLEFPEVQQTFFADRQCKVPAGNLFSADRPYFVPMAILHCRWKFPSAGVEAGLRTGRKGVLIADLPRSYPSSRAETTPVMTDMWPSAPRTHIPVCEFEYRARGHQNQYCWGSVIENQLSAVQRVAELVQNSQCLPFAEAGFMAAQSSEEIVVMAAVSEQGTTPQNEASISMSYPPRSPVVHPVWAPQLYQAREPTTFELMGMIGDLQRSVADLAYGMSASPPAAPYAGNFVPQEPPLLGRIVIELSQPEVASGYSRDMPVSTPTLDQAEAKGKDKAKVDADPIEQLLWAVEDLKARGMNKQQTSAIVTKAVDDAFPAPIKGSSSQAENRDGPRHAQTVPVVPNPAPGKVQKAKAAPADPFASASGKNPQTAKYLPRGRRVFHDLHMPLSRALLILAKNGHLKPLEPRPLPKNLPPTHDATLYCAYHQQSGHSTDGCSRLRHEVQDLIDNKVILPPTSGKPVTTQLLDFEGSDTASIQPLEEARVASFEAALEQEAPKPNQKEWISPEEARGATVMDTSANHCNSRSLRHREAFSSGTIWHGLATLLPFERLAGSKTQKGDPGKS
ncbi:hypothetical protein HYC85_029048 [Camellia sinensis]|uniref:Uncharacterized protein n=1 Tax=Camellia sinensis TaxID=4442 RepID=A0A7J7FXK3_CAMSI|nr:hypothetical protein HYC85_029048 [Camellia sinensis]